MCIALSFSFPPACVGLLKWLIQLILSLILVAIAIKQSLNLLSVPKAFRSEESSSTERVCFEVSHSLEVVSSYPRISFSSKASSSYKSAIILVAFSKHTCNPQHHQYLSHIQTLLLEAISTSSASRNGSHRIPRPSSTSWCALEPQHGSPSERNTTCTLHWNLA